MRKTPKSFWTYQADDPPPAPKDFVGDWESLSPGMRREIVRQRERRNALRETNAQ